jgi:hypothetical protein
MANIEELKTKILEFNEFIKTLDPTVREAAFNVLCANIISPGTASYSQTTSEALSPELTAFGSTDEIGSFISQYEHDKPKDNVMLLVAWLYSQYGSYPITAKEIKTLADEIGLIIPERADNTMRSAKHNGKTLFTQQAKGWKLTVAGELRLKDVYAVKKGTGQRPE